MELMRQSWQIVGRWLADCVGVVGYLSFWVVYLNSEVVYLIVRVVYLNGGLEWVTEWFAKRKWQENGTWEC